MESSPLLSLSTDASDGDDESEMGQGPLDHLSDVRETVPRASASSSALPGGGGGAASGPAIACHGAEADMPEAQALGKRVTPQVFVTSYAMGLSSNMTCQVVIKVSRSNLHDGAPT